MSPRQLLRLFESRRSESFDDQKTPTEIQSSETFSQNHQEFLEYVLSQIRQILGTANWHDPVSVDLASLLDRVEDLEAVRDHAVLVGALDGVNRDFLIPDGEKAVHSQVSGSRIKLYHNSRRLQESEFEVLESGGAGTGFDLIRLTAFAPKPNSILFADYIAA